MAEIAGDRVPHAYARQGEAIPLPFADGASTASSPATSTGTCNATRPTPSWPRRGGSAASSSWSTRPAPEPREAWDERILDDGSRHQVYKRWFTGDSLAEELGGGEVLHAGRWFVAVRA